MKTDAILVRAQPKEKEAFKEAADLAGISLSAWVRERLRLAAIRELESAGRPIPFIRPLRMGEVPSV
jgi:hypothetical protein